MSSFRTRNVPMGALLGVLLGCMAVVVVLGLAGQRSEDARAAEGLPPEIPRRDLPKVLDGVSLDAIQVGNWIVVGGDFTQVELQDDSVLNRSGLFAYDINTGLINSNFAPTLTRNSGVPIVLDLEAGPNNTVYVGGKFATIGGEAISRVARVSLSSGEVDTTFDAKLDGSVRTMALGNGDLYLGGEFANVDGQPRNRLARVDANTGALNPAFTFDITGSSRLNGVPYGPKMLHLTDDDVLVVVHRGRFVADQLRTGIAMIDVSNNTLLPWRTNFWAQNAIHSVDAEVSPDETYMVIAGDGGDFPTMGRDAAVAFSLTNTNQPNEQPIWIARNFDSTYAVGISEDAVFIGGHFCWVESNVAPDPWPGDGEFTNNNSCFGTFPASRFAPAVVYRDQIAALDPATGHALMWDPGSDALDGVQSIEVIDRGLLIGHDGERFGRDQEDSRAWNVGRHVFVDKTLQNAYQNTTLYIDRPVLGLCAGKAPTITGTTRADRIEGTPGNDVILAGPGADVVNGHGGHDTICGNEDVDRLNGGDGRDLLLGGEDRDRLFGGRGNDELRGEDGRDILVGDAGDDLLVGGKKFDRLSGRQGNDVLKGSVGPDRLRGGPGSDQLIGGAGSDFCFGYDEATTNDPGDTIAACER